jgi:hypothetical protein
VRWTGASEQVCLAASQISLFWQTGLSGTASGRGGTKVWNYDSQPAHGLRNGVLGLSAVLSAELEPGGGAGNQVGSSHPLLAAKEAGYRVVHTGAHDSLHSHCSEHPGDCGQ